MDLKTNHKSGFSPVEPGKSPFKIKPAELQQSSLRRGVKKDIAQEDFRSFKTPSLGRQGHFQSQID
jgi:hypothetical protein